MSAISRHTQHKTHYSLQTLRNTAHAQLFFTYRLSTHRTTAFCNSVLPHREACTWRSSNEACFSLYGPMLSTETLANFRTLHISIGRPVQMNPNLNTVFSTWTHAEEIIEKSCNKSTLAVHLTLRLPGERRGGRRQGAGRGSKRKI